MKKITALVFLATIICTAAPAQNISKAYITHTQEMGTLYFILPQDVFSNKTDGTLNMDITRLSSQDHVTLNYSFRAKDTTAADSVTFTAGANSYTYLVQRVYTQPAKKNTWEHRYSIELPFEEMCEIFTAEQPSSMNIHRGAARTEFVSKKNVWKKYSYNIRQIALIMTVNN